MNRRKFLSSALSAALTAVIMPSVLDVKAASHTEELNSSDRSKKRHGYCRAITMWDFSWLERRWPGAGFENWNKALDGLQERGYNAVRIDAYPHLVSAGAEKEWTLNEVWNQQTWGSPDINKVKVQPNLNRFIEKCKKRDIKVALSSWYRQDTDGVYKTIISPEKMASVWIDTLKSIQADGLLDNILYVDLCNEWPGDLWAPFFHDQHPNVVWGQWYKPESIQWMKNSIEMVKAEFPDLPLLFSFDCSDVRKYQEFSLPFFDAFEHHLWMAHQNNSEFYKLVGYKDGRFSPQAYKMVVKNAEKVYRQRPRYWQGLLAEKINLLGSVAKQLNVPLISTECWSIVDYKDWPLLDWEWVKELSEFGTLAALDTNAWIAMATSNFCAPQFVGMWRDVGWHKRLTKAITTKPVRKELYDNPNALKLLRRI